MKKAEGMSITDGLQRFWRKECRFCPKERFGWSFNEWRIDLPG